MGILPLLSDGKVSEKPMAGRAELLGLATGIVSAHIRNNAVDVEQLPGLIQQVFNALAAAEQATAGGVPL